MKKEEILQKVGFDLEKAKAIHQWLTDGESAQPTVQPTSGTDPHGIGIHTDNKGEKWVRVKVYDEDFLIATHNYKEGENTKFTWKEAGEIGTFSKKQAHIICAFIDVINGLLRAIDGEPLEGYYWSSTEDGSYPAWNVNFSSGNIGSGAKYNTYAVRPVAAF